MRLAPDHPPRKWKQLLTVAIGLLAAGIVLAAPPRALKVLTLTDGRIAVIDEATGKALHELAKPPGVIREMHVLDDGAVVATTTANRTEIWDAATGKLLRSFDERVFAFSHDQTRCVTFTLDHRLVLRNYPALAQTKVLCTERDGGPWAMRFSPDDRYLAVEFCNVYPLSDEMFLNPATNKTLKWLQLYDLVTGQAVPEVGGAFLGQFTPDSRCYVSGDDGRRFDLVTRTWLNPDSR